MEDGVSEIDRLDEIIKRVESLTGPDRDVDHDVFRFLGFRLIPFQSDPNSWRTRIGDKYIDTSRYPRGNTCTTDEYVAKLTSSLDLVSGLISSMIPQGWWRVESGLHSQSLAWVGRNLAYDPEQGCGATPSIALLLAFLRSLRVIRENATHKGQTP
jgi:hypothetical protein